MHEISEVHWISTKHQLADCLTKENSTTESALRQVLHTGTFESVEWNTTRSKKNGSASTDSLQHSFGK